MRKVWIVVANNTEATIYKAEDVKKLVALKSFQHEEGRLPCHELVSDRPGRATSHGKYGSSSLEEKTSPKTTENHHFARTLAHFLEEGHNKGEYERLYLVVKPPFLGHLHACLPHTVSQKVESEVHKDVVHLRPEQIRDYLPLTL